MSHPLFTNRLIKEKSPYLLQHAHNPVDWYPWGDEAFKVAQAENKPIFLSIGYATCHWCHVMEEESFQNEEIGKLMNDAFVNIKVDREEKPEVDSLYMEFAQAMMSGGAGWPLNLILTTDLMPFFAATYLPPDAGRGFLGLKQLILRIKQIWEEPEEREKVISQAGKIFDVFASNIHPLGKELPSQEEIREATELLFKLADPIYGGTKGAPKFPLGYQAALLLRWTKQTSDSRSLFYVERTLDMMQRGGIYDHLGGGFSRYSIDERWVIPHFEKMLYDNAILSRIYLEAYSFTKQNFYREVAEEIFEYVRREMTHPKGGFYSAQDADTEGQEGRYYTWTWDEINTHLGGDAPLFCEFYGVTPAGNFEGRNVLHLTSRLEEFAQKHKVDAVLVWEHFKKLRKKLLDKREERPRPFIDDKVITSWNGLMIYSLALGGRVLHSETYFQAAEKAAQFIKDSMWKDDTLFRRWREGEVRFDGCLDDYAFLIHGTLSLFEANRGTQWLKFAVDLAKVLKEDFKSKDGAFYLTNGKDPSVLLRRVEFYDGAEPSGNAVHCENLLRLHQITGNRDYLRQAEDILKAAKHHIDLYPPGAAYHLMSLMRYYDQQRPTLLVALGDGEETKHEIEEMLSNFNPHLSVIWSNEKDKPLFELLPEIRDKIPYGGRTSLYVCRQNRCEEPVTEPQAIKQIFEKL